MSQIVKKKKEAILSLMTNNTKQLISNVSTFYELACEGYHNNLSKYVQWIDSTRRNKSMAFPFSEKNPIGTNMKSDKYDEEK